MFAVTWGLALAVWRSATIEERWSIGMELAAARSGATGRARPSALPPPRAV
jgi:hypothetical protein